MRLCKLISEQKLSWAVIAVGILLAFHAVACASDLDEQYESPTEDDIYNAQEADSEPAEPAAIAERPEVLREQYRDGKPKVEREVTVDADGNYVNHGLWRWVSPAGEVVAEGHFDHGKRVGIWTRWRRRSDAAELSEYPFNQFEAPFQTQATFVNDQMEGEWLITDAAERKCMQISLFGGLREGEAITWLPNGKVYRQSRYKNGVLDGDVRELDEKSGELKTVASFVEGRKAIHESNYYPRRHQPMTESAYLGPANVLRSADDFWALRFAQYGSEGNQLRHGLSKIWFENGVVQQEGNYQYDKKWGEFIYRYDNGQVAVTGEYKDGIADGTWTWWHENGQKAILGRIEAGALVGEWRRWNEDGKLADTKFFDGTQPAGADPRDLIRIGRMPGAAKSR